MAGVERWKGGPYAKTLVSLRWVDIVGSPAVAVVRRSGRDGRIWMTTSTADACVTVFGIRGVHTGICKGPLESQSMAEISGATDSLVLRVSKNLPRASSVEFYDTGARRSYGVLLAKTFGFGSCRSNNAGLDNHGTI